MSVPTYDDTIAEAKKVLKIADREFSLLSFEQAQTIVTHIETRYVDGHNWVWWWEHFIEQTYTKQHREDQAFMVLSRLLPKLNEKVWFVVEPWGEKRQFSVYVVAAQHIEPVLGEYYSFDYYIVSHELGWLVGENHHGCFFCIGEPVTTRMQEIVHSEPERWF